MKTVTATELARNLSDFLNRVRYQGESFGVIRGRELVARLVGLEEDVRTTGNDLCATLAQLEHPDRQFADDLESVQAEQPMSSEEDPWAI